MYLSAEKLSVYPRVPGALVMQGMVDVNSMGCSSLAAHSADIHQSKESRCDREPLPTAFYPHIKG
jgi:hypothetical protein